MTATVNIKKNRPNYYVLLRYYDNGEERHKTKWFTTDIPIKGNNKRRAERRKDEILNKCKNYENIKIKQKSSSDNIYFLDFYKDWLETMKKTNEIRVSTYEGYLIVFNNHILPYFEPMKLKITEIEPIHIQKYVNKKLEKLSPNTVKKHITNISKCLDSAVFQNIIAINPTQRIGKIKKIKYNGANFLREKEIIQLLNCSKGDPLEIVILLTLFYGLRRSEVLGLKWSAIDFENNIIEINHTVVRVSSTRNEDSTKNDSSNAALPLPNILKRHLKEWKAVQAKNKRLQPNDYVDSDYVCTMFDGRLMLPGYISKHFKLILSRNSLKEIRFHDLRHSSASYLKYLGFDLKDIQSWLRHSDIQTSMNLYTHLDMQDKIEVAKKLDERISNSGF